MLTTRRLQFGAALFLKAPVASPDAMETNKGSGPVDVLDKLLAATDLVQKEVETGDSFRMAAREEKPRFPKGVLLRGSDVLCVYLPNGDRAQTRLNAGKLRAFANESGVPAILNLRINSETSALMRAGRLHDHWERQRREIVLNPFAPEEEGP